MVIFSSVAKPEVVGLLRKGKVGVIPTDTIYGLVAVASNPKAVERLYMLKDRSGKPGPIIAADVGQLVALGLNEADLRAVEHLWPNPLSIVIDSSDDLEYLHQSVGSLAVRIPKDKALRDLLAQTGPLLTSSANLPGQSPATALAEAERYFGETVDFYVDGGELGHRPPSTVARVKNGRLEILRSGAVTINEKGEIIR